MLLLPVGLLPVEDRLGVEVREGETTAGVDATTFIEPVLAVKELFARELLLVNRAIISFRIMVSWYDGGDTGMQLTGAGGEDDGDDEGDDVNEVEEVGSGVEVVTALIIDSTEWWWLSLLEDREDTLPVDPKTFFGKVGTDFMTWELVVGRWW